MSVKTRKITIKCFFYFWSLFSITGYAGSDYNLLSQQLGSEATHIQSFNQLKLLSKKDPAALTPLFRFVCSDYATRNGGEDYKRIKAVITYLQEYGSENEVSETTLDVLFAIKKEYYDAGSKRHNNLIYVLENISASQRFSDNVLNKVMKLTSFQVAEDKKKNHNYSFLYFQILKHQTKYRPLPEKARYLAIQVITDQAANNRVFYPPIDMLVGQLKYNDINSEKTLIGMMQPGNNLQLRRSVTDRLAQRYDEQSKLNTFSQKVLAIYEKEKNKEMQAYYRKLLLRLNKNKQITPEISEKILKLAYEVPDKKVKYGASVALMQAYLRKSETSVLMENELESVLGAFSGSNTVAMHYASKVILAINDAGNMTKNLHERLIELFFSGKNSAQQLNMFKKVIMENIPYRNVEMKYQNSRYPDALLIGVTENTRKPSTKVSALLVINFIQAVYQHQPLPQKVVEGLYDIYARQNQLKVQQMFAELFVRYYRDTGYTRTGLFAHGLYRSSFDYQEEVRDVIREALSNKYGLKEGLFKMFSDQALDIRTRSFFLSELVNEDFDYASKMLLPPDDEEEKFQEVIWDDFYRKSYNNANRVNEEILRTAIGSQNYKIRHLAWRMLEEHDVATPFMVKWERKRFREEFTAKALFFAGGPLTLIIGSLLFLKNTKGRTEKYDWMKTARIIAWILTTLAGFAVGIVGLLLSGMSHSGVPYDFIAGLLATICTVYLIVSLVTRLLIPTVLIEQIKNGDRSV